jgi:hypothetical protein
LTAESGELSVIADQMASVEEVILEEKTTVEENAAKSEGKLSVERR